MIANILQPKKKITLDEARVADLGFKLLLFVSAAKSRVPALGPMGMW
jgi:hypothetical protein